MKEDSTDYVRKCRKKDTRVEIPEEAWLLEVSVLHDSDLEGLQLEVIDRCFYSTTAEIQNA